MHASRATARSPRGVRSAWGRAADRADRMGAVCLVRGSTWSCRRSPLRARGTST